MINTMRSLLQRKKVVTPDVVVWILLVGALLSMPFGTRKLLYHVTSGFDEYTSMFFYGSDIFLIAFFGAVIGSFGWRKFFSSFQLPLLLFVGVALLGILWAHNIYLALYVFARLLTLAALFVSLKIFLRKKSSYIDTAMGLLGFSAVIQAIVGISQFMRQKSVGLWLLGEPQIGPGTPGVARIATAYGRLVRAYGTLPHANIYAAFLVVGLIALLYIWIRRGSMFSENIIKRLLFSAIVGISTFVVLMGLVVSFSRSGWISALIASVIFLGGLFTVRSYRHDALRIGLLMIFMLALLFQLFNFAIMPRIEMTTSKDYAISARLTYNQLGVNLVKQNPFGIGVGNQVLYAVDSKSYHSAGMNERWQWQPIHNIYLLIATETGIFGLIFFLMFIGDIFWKKRVGTFSEDSSHPPLLQSLSKITKKMGAHLPFARKNIDTQTDSAIRILATATMVLALLLMGLSDHFLWDLQPGKILLWSVLGIAAASMTHESSPLD